MLKNKTQEHEEIEFNKGFKFVAAFLAFAVAMVFASYAHAFSSGHALDEHGNATIPYFSFNHWSAWSDSGGYLEVAFTPADGSEQQFFRLEGSQGRFYYEFNGLWTFFPKLSNGEQAGTQLFFQYDITTAKPEYDGSFNKYQDLDPSESADWTGASPINDTTDFNKPEAEDPSSGGGDDGTGGDGGDTGGGGDGTGGSGGNGGDTGGSDGSGDGGGCGCFHETPAWQDLMDRLNQIKDKIPPPPNWNEVADTMRDSIVPRLIDDLDTLLGRAPDPPSLPSQDIQIQEPSRTGPNVDIPDYAGELNESYPDLEQVPGLADSGFTLDDIKNQAPEIEFREDPTGGFNIGNPLDMLPSIPSEPPIPGQGSAGEWDHQPQQPSLQTPMPSGGGEVTQPEPPVPSGGGGGSTAPIPDQSFTPPAPSETELDVGNYKRHPDHADGSG